MKTQAHIKKAKGEAVFDAGNIILMCLLVVLAVYPFLYMIFASFSDSLKLFTHSGFLWHPLGFSLSGYKTALSSPVLLSGFKNTFIILIFGTLINIVLTVQSAYVLSRPEPMLNTFILKMCVFTMYFSGGMIPSYLLVKNLGMIDTYAALILPGAINTTNLIIMRTSFQNLPDSLIESARIDGANEIKILVRIVVPLSMATIAVITLYYAVGHWNSWFNAYIYLQSRSKYPLQLVLREILMDENQDNLIILNQGAERKAEGDVLKYSMMVIGTVPILLIYPFLQKYFTKGVMIGAIKS